MNSQEFGRLSQAEEDDIQRIVGDLEQVAEEIRNRARRGHDRDELLAQLKRLTGLRYQLDVAIAGEVVS